MPTGHGHRDSLRDKGMMWVLNQAIRIGIHKIVREECARIASEGRAKVILIEPSTASGIYVEPNTPEMLAIGQYLADQLKAATDHTWPVASTTGAPCPGSVYLSATGDASLGAEGYQLDVSAQMVQLKAPQSAGVFHGVQTLRQLLPANFEGAGMQAGPPWGIAAGTIRDNPRFVWRGMMLDVARHFFAVPDVEKLIDLAAYFKLNVFHLHLSDDQGFRIAINSWPKLTSVGGSTAVGGGAGGFYTQADYSALVTYAKARYITIVPEVDVPGHTNAAMLGSSAVRRPRSPRYF